MDELDEIEVDMDNPDDLDVPKPKKKKAAKAKKPKEAKVKEPEPKPEKPSKRDQFGLLLGSKVSEAVALYAREEGATLDEVREVVGSIKYNILKRLREEGHTLTESKEAGKKNRTVTRYFLRAK